MTLHLFGVRHHGPGSARALVRALDEVRPDVVLVEAPAEATAAFAWVGRGLVPPVALLGYVVDQPHRAVFAPLAVFSPEWQAVAWANAHAVAVTAIDLPLAHTLADGSADTALFAPGEAPRDPLGALAAAAGEPDAERWWDDVIEHRGHEAGSALAAFAAVAEAMAAVRAGSLPSAAEARREAHMRRAIRAALAEHAVVAVVCGAWHVPVLDVTAPGAPTATADNAALRRLPKAKVGLSWVPWTHQRLAAAGGYGAGVRSPGWYAHVFAHPGADGVARFFVEAARVLRAADLAASPDHLISATRMAGTLAALRGRPHPGLDEVLDAATTVMGGRPLVERRLIVGEAIGRVPPEAPQVPLAADLTRRRKAARLALDDAPSVIELDLRTPNGRRRSHLLHQLTAIGVPWGVLTEGRGSSGTFRETWQVEWEPEFSVRIVEHAGYGTTVEQAATNRLVERAERAEALLDVAAALDLALLADLPEAVAPVVARLAQRAATDPDIAQLMATLGPLAGAQRYGDVRGTDRAALRDVFDGIVVRVLAGLAAACRSLDDDAAAAMAERISEVQHALALIDHPARRSRFPAVLAELAERSATAGAGLIAGRATRVLHDAGAWAPERVGARLGRALSGGTPPAVGAAFVEGFLAGSGTVLVHDAVLRGIVDAWLASLTPEAFEATVPLLRRTFGAFDAAERHQLGRLVRGAASPADAARWGPEVDPVRLELVATTVRHLFGLATHHTAPEAGS